MTDREKVILGLEVCISNENENPCELCPYFSDGLCQELMKEDALALLREQEPIWKEGIPFCGECRTAMSKTQDYCHKCGRKVKWDG